MEPLHIPGIENGWKVDYAIWRGAQPSDTAWPLLAKAGCLSVIDLNSTGPEINRQHELVYGAGLVYTAFDWSGILPPSQSAIQQVLAEIDHRITSHHTPVFVHCLHGSDRTGVLCAIWRMHDDSWTFEAAMKEAFLDLGLQGMHEFWMASAVAEYEQQREIARAAVLAERAKQKGVCIG
jgi:tyrosine-protein phosphatase SIW14